MIWLAAGKGQLGLLEYLTDRGFKFPTRIAHGYFST